MDCCISQRDSLLCTNLNEFNRSISWETKINSCVGGGGGPWLMAKSFPRPPTHHQQCSLDGGRERTYEWVEREECPMQGTVLRDTWWGTWMGNGTKRNGPSSRTGLDRPGWDIIWHENGLWTANWTQRNLKFHPRTSAAIQPGRIERMRTPTDRAGTGRDRWNG